MRNLMVRFCATLFRSGARYVFILFSVFYYATVVRNWLDRSFDQRWLGRAGPHEWPARSPDLTPCDFFLWGYVKELVYKSNPTNLDELETAIRDAIASIPRQHLNSSCESVRDRIVKLRRNGGGHIEY